MNAGVVRPGEGLKEMRDKVFMHTDSRVGYDEGILSLSLCKRGSFLDSQSDGSAFRRIFDGIGQRIDKHLLQAAAVCHHLFMADTIGIYLKRLMFFPDQGTEYIHHIFNQFWQRDFLR